MSSTDLIQRQNLSDDDRRVYDDLVNIFGNISEVDIDAEIEQRTSQQDGASSGQSSADDLGREISLLSRYKRLFSA